MPLSGMDGLAQLSSWQETRWHCTCAPPAATTPNRINHVHPNITCQCSVAFVLRRAMILNRTAKYLHLCPCGSFENMLLAPRELKKRHRPKKGDGKIFLDPLVFWPFVPKQIEQPRILLSWKGSHHQDGHVKILRSSNGPSVREL